MRRTFASLIWGGWENVPPLEKQAILLEEKKAEDIIEHLEELASQLPKAV